MKQILLLMMAVVLVGCAGINWNDRVGVYTYEQAVIEYGPMDAVKNLDGGGKVAAWVLTNGNAKTYLDGEVVEVRPFPVNTNNYYFSNIGGSHISDQTLLGEIDDVRIYDRALSGEEVKALYEMEKP